jgi:hypothetical protein
LRVKSSEIRAPFALQSTARAAFGQWPATIVSASREHPMMDVVMLAIGLVFFAASIAYVFACDQL